MGKGRARASATVSRSRRPTVKQPGEAVPLSLASPARFRYATLSTGVLLVGSRWAWEAGSLPNLAVPAASCAALRTVKRLTGLSFHRLIGASADELDTYLRRERAKGRPVTYLHMAVHAGPTARHRQP